jgi:hypothetical protein
MPDVSLPPNSNSVTNCDTEEIKATIRNVNNDLECPELNNVSVTMTKSGNAWQGVSDPIAKLTLCDESGAPTDYNNATVRIAVTKANNRWQVQVTANIPAAHKLIFGSIAIAGDASECPLGTVPCVSVDGGPALGPGRWSCCGSTYGAKAADVVLEDVGEPGCPAEPFDDCAASFTATISGASGSACCTELNRTITLTKSGSNWSWNTTLSGGGVQGTIFVSVTCEDDKWKASVGGCLHQNSPACFWGGSFAGEIDATTKSCPEGTYTLAKVSGPDSCGTSLQFVIAPVS